MIIFLRPYQTLLSKFPLVLSHRNFRLFRQNNPKHGSSKQGVANFFGPRAIFRNFDGGAGHTTQFDFFIFCIFIEFMGCYSVINYFPVFFSYFFCVHGFLLFKVFRFKI